MDLLIAMMQPDVEPVPVAAFTWYTSIVGIVGATAVIVSILKRLLARASYLNAVPTWLYAVAVSFALTAVAAFWFHTLPGDPWQNIMQAVLMAAASSGVFEWIKADNITKPLAASAKSAGVKIPVKDLPDSMK